MSDCCSAMRGFVLILAVISRVAVAIRGGGGRGGRGLWDNLGQQKQTQADDKADFWAQLAGKSEAGIASTTERFTNRNSYFASSQRRVSETDRQDAKHMLHALNTKSYADSKQNSGQSRIGGGPLEHYWTNDQAGSQRRSDDRPATALQQSGNEHNKAESRIDEVMRVHRYRKIYILWSLGGNFWGYNDFMQIFYLCIYVFWKIYKCLKSMI